jgi:anhydro-N-acetylmuramic acid kinase
MATVSTRDERDSRAGEDAAGRLCVGLISGTSADGIDAALVRIGGAGAEAAVTLIAFRSTPYPPEVRRELLALYAPDAANAIARLCSLNVVLGELFAAAAATVCRDGAVPVSDLHVVGSHGQTVWYQAGPEAALPLSIRSTLQVAEPAVIAERLGVPVVADFRTADLAAGGHGAPLVPYFDWVTLRHPARRRAAQNIGGIGNVTYLPAGGAVGEVRAFDTGPGNMVIDGLMTLLTAGAAAFDRDGELAASGTVDRALLDDLLTDEYLRRPPPKGTGREVYGLPFARRLLAEAGLEEGDLVQGVTPAAGVQQRACNLIATATAFTVASIVDGYQQWLPPVDEVIVSGGGSRNPTLMRWLGEALAPARVAPIDAYGIDGRAKEAMAFALMAHDGLAGLPTNVPGATGARRAVTLGKLTPPA